jgi:hypothetical protein
MLRCRPMKTSRWSRRRTSHPGSIRAACSFDSEANPEGVSSPRWRRSKGCSSFVQTVRALRRARPTWCQLTRRLRRTHCGHNSGIWRTSLRDSVRTCRRAPGDVGRYCSRHAHLLLASDLRANLWTAFSTSRRTLTVGPMGASVGVCRRSSPRAVRMPALYRESLRLVTTPSRPRRRTASITWSADPESDCENGNPEPRTIGSSRPFRSSSRSLVKS